MFTFESMYELCYGPEEDAAAAEAAKKTAEEEEAKRKAVEDEPLEDIPESIRNKKTLTQEEFNRALKEDRLKHKVKIEKSIRDLENLRKSQSITEKDRQELKTRIEELQNSLLTKEQLAAKERERLESQHKQTIQSMAAEKEMWENRFKKSTINTAIVSESAKADAFDSDALIAILGPSTRLAEETDNDGKPTDRFIPKTKFNDVDSEGKPITLDLTVPEVIKRMKETPKYGYLFKSTAAGGLGTPAPAGPGQKVDVSKMSTEQYREHRKKNGLARRPGA